MAKSTDRSSREDWINAALKLLAESGLDAITIDALCKSLGLTPADARTLAKLSLATSVGIFAITPSFGEHTHGELEGMFGDLIERLRKEPLPRG